MRGNPTINDVRGRSNGTVDEVIDAVADALGAAFGSEHDPAVATTRDGWVVAFARRIGGGSILCQVVKLDPANSRPLVGPEALIGYAPGGNLHGIASTGDTCVAAYSSVTTNPDNSALTAQPIDPFHCAPCGGAITLATGPPHINAFPWIAVGSQWDSDSSAGEGALFAWSLPASRTISTQRFVAADGVLTDLGGGCGVGARARASCAVASNLEFTLRVVNAPPSVPALLVLGARRLDFGCGGCVLVPDPVSGVVTFAGQTGQLGRASLRVALPSSANLVGQTFLEQWLLIAPTAPCPLASTEFSNALRVAIE